ncbi:ATP-binding protein [Actinacidiphila sp. bgisy167]|uniref:ATP-binding protein n=1 Tax=Actinacidiphila sp. bgisy167 TaxID=3413797 RepID=UPI003D755B12
MTTQHFGSPAADAPRHCPHTAPLPAAPHSSGGPDRVAIFGFLPAEERVPEVRRAITRLLGHWGIDADLCDAAALTVSELTANAVVHASVSASITVVLELASHLRIEVRDGSKQLPVLRTATGPESENGRGLALVATLCSEWGTTLYGASGKSVWARFPLPSA